MARHTRLLTLDATLNQAIVPLAAVLGISPELRLGPRRESVLRPYRYPASDRSSGDPPEFATTASKDVVRRAVRRWAALLQVDMVGFYWRSATGKSWHALDEPHASSRCS